MQFRGLGRRGCRSTCACVWLWWDRLCLCASVSGRQLSLGRVIFEDCLPQSGTQGCLLLLSEPKDDQSTFWQDCCKVKLSNRQMHCPEPQQSGSWACNGPVKLGHLQDLPKLCSGHVQWTTVHVSGQASNRTTCAQILSQIRNKDSIHRQPWLMTSAAVSGSRTSPAGLTKLHSCWHTLSVPCHEQWWLSWSQPRQLQRPSLLSAADCAPVEPSPQAPPPPLPASGAQPVRLQGQLSMCKEPPLTKKWLIINFCCSRRLI